jgi:hypothetical protein
VGVQGERYRADVSSGKRVLCYVSYRGELCVPVNTYAENLAGRNGIRVEDWYIIGP